MVTIVKNRRCGNVWFSLAAMAGLVLIATACGARGGRPDLGIAATAEPASQPSPSATAFGGPTPPPANDAADFQGLAITSSALTGDGSLWYALDQFDSIGGSSPYEPNRGLYRLKDGRVTHFDIPATIRVLEAGPDGHLYLGAGCGVMRFVDGRPETLLEVDCSAPSPVDGLFPLNISFAEDGRIWVGGATRLASFDGRDWEAYDISALRVALADDGSIWAKGWDGRAGSNCCLTHLTGGDWITYTWEAEIPAGPILPD